MITRSRSMMGESRRKLESFGWIHLAVASHDLLWVQLRNWNTHTLRYTIMTDLGVMMMYRNVCMHQHGMT
jgi:hypothetical protein